MVLLQVRIGLQKSAPEVMVKGLGLTCLTLKIKTQAKAMFLQEQSLKQELRVLCVGLGKRAGQGDCKKMKVRQGP